MKLIPFILAMFVLLPFAAQADQFEDDHKTLEKLIGANENFFDAITMNGKILYNYDEDGNPKNDIVLDKAEIRKLIEEYKAMPDFWDYAKQAKCDSLSLSTAAMGACLHRHTAIALTAFAKNFKMTKQAIRSQNKQLSIKAVKKFSATVKKVTLYLTTACDLSSAMAWGGSGQGLMQASCVISEVEKASEFLQGYRGMLREGDDSPQMQRRRQEAMGLSSALWDAKNDENLGWLKDREDELKTKVKDYFKDFSEAAITSTLQSIDYSRMIWSATRADYCETYALITFPTYEEYIDHGDQAKGACTDKLIHKRFDEINDLITGFSQQ